MKKLILALLVVAFVLGCEDMKPDSWDSSKGNWEIKARGTLVSKEKARHPSCDVSPPKTCSNHKGILLLQFYDGTEIAIGRIRNIGIIKVGQKGTLYKNDKGNHDYNSWFQWIITQEAPVNTNAEIRVPTARFAIEDLKVEEPKIVEKIVVKKHEWKRAAVYKPTVYQLVLIRLDNGIITTGRFTDDSKWRLETNKNKRSKIYSVEVVDWKELDIN